MDAMDKMVIEYHTDTEGHRLTLYRAGGFMHQVWRSPWWETVGEETHVMPELVAAADAARRAVWPELPLGVAEVVEILFPPSRR